MARVGTVLGEPTQRMQVNAAGIQEMSRGWAESQIIKDLILPIMTKECHRGESRCSRVLEIRVQD